MHINALLLFIDLLFELLEILDCVFKNKRKCMRVDYLTLL